MVIRNAFHTLISKSRIVCAYLCSFAFFPHRWIEQGSLDGHDAVGSQLEATLSTVGRKEVADTCAACEMSYALILRRLGRIGRGQKWT